MIPLIIYGLLVLKYLGSVQYLSSHVAIPFLTCLLYLNSRRPQFPLERNVIINKKSNLEGWTAPIHFCSRRADDRIWRFEPLTQVRRRKDCSILLNFWGHKLSTGLMLTLLHFCPTKKHIFNFQLGVFGYPGNLATWSCHGKISTRQLVSSSHRSPHRGSLNFGLGQ